MAILQRIWYRLLREWWSVTVPLRIRSQGVSIGTRVTFYGMPIISMAPDSVISIGDRSVICSDSRFTALGVNHPVVLRTLCPGASIVIGTDTGISGGSICSAKNVGIGSHCLLGANVVVADTDFHAIKSTDRRYGKDKRYIEEAAINIGDNVFIGTGSIILKGTTIGNNSVIGALSTVTSDVAPDTIFAGCPAKMVGKAPK